MAASKFTAIPGQVFLYYLIQVPHYKTNATISLELGDLRIKEALVADLKNAEFSVNVQCCSGTPGARVVSKTCGRGTPCLNICGFQPGNLSEILNYDYTTFEDEIQFEPLQSCNDGATSRRRSATCASYHLAFCGRYVRVIQAVNKYPVCCFNPSIKRKFLETCKNKVICA